jgi:hypothetical protein
MIFNFMSDILGTFLLTAVNAALLAPSSQPDRSPQCHLMPPRMPGRRRIRAR